MKEEKSFGHSSPLLSSSFTPSHSSLSDPGRRISSQTEMGVLFQSAASVSSVEGLGLAVDEQERVSGPL